MKPGFTTIEHQVDFCVVGGGMAGFCAAIAAARHGARVVLMHDRPVLGGNASSEMRMHICGAERHSLPNLRETGILEELRLANLYRNPQRSFSVWDTILWETAAAETNLTLLLNCSCLDATLAHDRIAAVTGWQLTTQQYHRVSARIFADCSGDGVLAPLTGADCRRGREARDEFHESIAPEIADDRTMGMTCLFQSRLCDRPMPFVVPAWAERFENCDDLPYGARGHSHWWQMGYWWVELGGEHDSIADTERLRDKLLGIAYGVWDHIKNRCPHTREPAANWALDWVQFLPAKRESRRYIGRHILTQNDITAGGRFDDVVAYGGWSMDDHHPAGFRAVRVAAPATIFHEAPTPYGIPYGTLVSRNIANLMFAGRCASATHAAMSSTRVMGTCAVQGQATGTAAALAIVRGLDPAGVSDHIPELQQRLLADDCYLPGVPEQPASVTTAAKLTVSQGDPEPLRDGWRRPIGDNHHAWKARPGDWVRYDFAPPRPVDFVTLVLDSALDKIVQMSYHQNDGQLTAPPPEMPRAYRLEALIDSAWQTLITETANHQRHRQHPIGRTVSALRFTLDATWGGRADQASRMFSFLVR